MLNRRFIVFLAFSFALLLSVKATHNRAGEITYKRIAPFTRDIGGEIVQVFTYSITVIKYTDDGTGIADRCVDTVYFGDGDRGIAPRVNGPSGCNCGSFGGVAVGCGSVIINEAGYRVKVNIYTIVHTYPGAGNFLIRTFDPNRNEGVHNIPNSVNLPFYIESKLIINNFTGANSSPIFTFPPVDRACANVCFEHNPMAFDPDGDSLSYEISTSRGVDGKTVAGYFYPETGGGTFGINALTGSLKWCTPQLLGEYNIAFIVKEWRKNTSGNYILIGYVLRDMQVIVKTCETNQPPSITVPPDICVEAGKTVTANLTVSDPNNGSTVTVEGGGGPFTGLSPHATFSPASGITFSSSGNSFNVFFSWQTTCAHIRYQPYQTGFKVQDDGKPATQNSSTLVKLVSFNSFNIRVVPPSVKNVTATPAGSTMKISWSLSSCSPADNPLVGYKIYRKEDCATFIPEPCTTGVPASSGFTYLDQTSATTTLYIDSNKGDGLVVGQNYSYLVVAVYKDGLETFGSTQVCAKLKRDVPVLLNVDVVSTSQTNGSIFVKWTRPLTTPGNFDPSVYPGPYQFNLKYRPDHNASFTTVHSTTHTLLSQLDTSFTHADINTAQVQYEYIVEFVSGTVSIGSSQVASSVSLTTSPSDRKISLKWNNKTPWNNYTYTIFRKDPASTTFTVIGTTTLTTYSDSLKIANRNTYCYYVLTEGQYSDPSIYKPLLNKSQESCVTAIDLTPPCTPTLNVEADCPTGLVKVMWNDVNKICSDDVIKYVLYFKPTVNDPYSEIFTTNVTKTETLTSFQPDNLELIAGCYAIQAIDSSNNASKLSPDFCIDNCPLFELPDVFTPNGDDINDHFKAVKVRQIKEIDLAIVDRWGHLVYQTKDPYFKWDGTSSVSKRPVSEGTFFYVCTVFEPRVKGIVKRTLKGHLQVIR